MPDANFLGLRREAADLDGCSAATRRRPGWTTRSTTSRRTVSAPGGRRPPLDGVGAHARQVYA